MRTRKKRLLILLLSIFLILDVMLIIRITGLAQRSRDHRHWEEQLLEAFLPLPSVSGNPRDAVHPSRKTVLIHFLPDCHFCQNEAAALRDHLPAFAETRLLLVSAAGRKEVEGFAANYELAGRPNVHFFLDPQQQFAGLFGTQAVPAIFIYDEQGQLIRRYQGETRIEAILQHLNSDSHEAISKPSY